MVTDMITAEDNILFLLIHATGFSHIIDLYII